MSFHSTEVQIMAYGNPAYNAVQLKLPGKKSTEEKRDALFTHSANISGTKMVNSDIYILICILYPITYTFKRTAAPTLSRLKTESPLNAVKRTIFQAKNLN